MMTGQTLKVYCSNIVQGHDLADYTSAQIRNFRISDGHLHLLDKIFPRCCSSF
jgi:hypothetical protein